MQDFIIALLICSVTMSVLALFYMSVTPPLARRYSVTGRYYVWLVIVIGLIIPFRPQFNNAIVKIDMPRNTVVPVIQTGNKASAATAVPNTVPSVLENISWWHIIAAVWLAGMIIFFAYHVIRHYRFLKLISHWSKNITDEQTLTLFRNLKTQMGLTKNLGLQLCDSVGSPMLIGFANPRILLPKADFEEAELCLILKHELIHYKRRDLWYKCLVLTATAIHWFNPIIYLMARVIDIQCELSCDKEVVRSADADTRKYYIEAIIGVIREQSKLKTALSTNFYGGKKGMKRRIFSIMDMSKRRTGAVIFCGALILTIGTGFAFSADAKTLDSPQIMAGEDTASPFAYGFSPDREVYSQYSSLGITISDDGEMLLYNGQRVRLFVDEHSDTEAFFLDEAGTLDLNVIRNTAGNITDIENISEQRAKEYRSAFFDGDNKSSVEVQDAVQDITGENKLEQYTEYGIVLSADNHISYNGQPVKLLVDLLSDGIFETYWVDEAGTVNLSVIRDTSGQITGVESITDEKAQEYRSAADEYPQIDLDSLEEKIESKMKALYPKN